VSFLISRRCALVAAALAYRPAVQAQVTVRPLATRSIPCDEPIAQLTAGGPTGLLAVSVTGTLWALPALGSGSARKLGEALDPTTPIAVGHARVAARRHDGGLWVLEDGRVGQSGAGLLAPAAGLLVLPLAVIAVQAEAGVGTSTVHHAIRLEPSNPQTWAVVARSAANLLPDAAPLQADLDGSGDGGHVVVLGGPNDQRYPHGVLGDRVEATRAYLLERHSLRVMRELTVGEPHVLEDIAPRKVSLGQRDGLLTVRSGPQGGQLALLDADPAASGALRIAALGAPLGTANRWMSPTVHGKHWLAVHTPHIGGVLHAYQQQGRQLVAGTLRSGVSNHRIGSRQLNLSAWHGQRLLIPDQSGLRVLLLDGAVQWSGVGEYTLPSRVAAMVSLGGSGSVAVLMDNGAVMVLVVG
jgi:hypothetical protein